MPHQPPAPDADAVRQLLAPVPPECEIRPVDEGGEHSTWWIGPDRVLRLALDEDGSVRQGREIALRDALRPALSVAVPESVAHGQWAPGLTYTLDTRLGGVSAERRAVSDLGERALARMLMELRAFPVERAAELGVPVAAPRDSVALWETAGQPPGGPGPAATATAGVLTHRDLKGEHLLIDSAGGVSGVLDWTDAVIGDPAEDIAGLAISVGAPAAVRAARLAGYGPEVCARGVWLARYDTVIRLVDRLRGTDDSPLPLLRVQRDRAWTSPGGRPAPGARRP
ncbi:aminoglycoside phosphotransferase family protein [Streptomyces sp. NPDC020965]|uniref:aminoglycoside phosphotransferase family protein n=1 Tax=Streptomyces sp. NPDC020965 TaxID=3365105 RepID=UPI003798E74F